jgi:transcriptional regulator with PAS, ATPase and Fis domain
MNDAARLLQDQSFVRTLIDSLPCGFMVLDEEGRVQVMNNITERVFGITEQTAIGKQQGEALNCIHVLESSARCGSTGYCSDCQTRKLAFSALSKNRKQTGKTYLQLLINGQLRNLTLLLSAVPFSFADQRSVILLIENISELIPLSPPISKNGFRGLVGQDEKMQGLFDTIRQVARTNASVLIQGESGTGKELVALAIHKESARANNYFVPVNCGALPENLVETELFGHVKGAFTGAIHDKKGRFELANHGTIFLDEVGELSPAMQKKLLRVLENGEIQRVGSEQTIKVDVRVISATNKNLEEEVSVGRFREDLYYRLCVVPITVPPLRERRGDIPLLSEYFLTQFSREPGLHKVTLSSAAQSLMMAYPWPGNVRELQNVLQYALIRCQGEVIEPYHLPMILPKPLSVGRREPKLQAEDVALAMQKAGGNKRQAAKILGVSRSTLYRFFDRQKETS